MDFEYRRGATAVPKKSDLITYYRHVQSRPVMLKTVRAGIYRHQWYASALDAEADYFNARREDTRLGQPKTAGPSYGS